MWSGRHELAASLETQGHTVAVIDKSADAFRRLPEDFVGQHDRRASASTATTCVEAGSSEAGALAAVTSGDNSNILVARIARETFGIERVVARIYDPRRAAIYQRLGIPTVATVAWTTDQVLRRLLPDDAGHEWIDPTGKVVPRRARRSRRRGPGKKLADLERSRRRLRLVARHPARRGARSSTPDARRPGGRRRCTSPSTSTAIDELDAHLGWPEHGRPLMRVVIAGGGNVGTFIADDLREARATRS